MSDETLTFTQLEREEELMANDEDEKARVISIFEDLIKELNKLENEINNIDTNIYLEREIDNNIENILKNIEEITFDCRQVIEKMEGRI